MRPVAVPGSAMTTAAVGLRLAVIAAAALAVILWGATPLATKVAVTAVDPVAVGLLRTLLAGAIALPVALLAGMALPRSRPARLALLASAFSGYLVFPVLFSLGQARTSAGHGAMILALTPIFTGLIAAAIERARPERAWWLGSAVAVTGTAILVGESFGFTAGDAGLAGDLLVLAGCLAAACGYVAGARAAREAGSWPVTLWGIVLASAILLPATPFILSLDQLSAAPVTAWTALLYLALVSSILAYSAWYWALAKGGIGTTGTIQFAQPLVGLALAVWILGEVLTPPLILASLLIIAGVTLARRATRPRNP